MSARRLAVLVKHLPRDAAVVRAISPDGQIPFSRLENLVADVWALWAKKDHPVRAEMAEKARTEAKLARVIKMNEKRKRTYGLG